MGDSESKVCPRCGVSLSESNMVEHLKTCERLYINATRPDGSSLTYDHKSSSSQSVRDTATAIANALGNNALTYGKRS